MNYVQARQARGEVVTGLLYVDPSAGDLHDALNTVADAAERARRGRAVPGRAMLAKINASLSVDAEAPDRESAVRPASTRHPSAASTTNSARL